LGLVACVGIVAVLHSMSLPLSSEWNDYEAFQKGRDTKCYAQAEITADMNANETIPKLKSRYLKPAEQGDAFAQYCLANYYQVGTHIGGGEDYVLAAKWLQLAAKQGDRYAQYNLAHLYDVGLISKNPVEAFKWFLLAAEQGDGRAQLAIGYIYHGGAPSYGATVKEDQVAARKWFLLAANQGDPTAQYWIGYLHENGLGGNVDYALARKWYNRAVKQGFEPAQQNLAGLKLRNK